MKKQRMIRIIISIQCTFLVLLIVGIFMKAYTYYGEDHNRGEIKPITFAGKYQVDDEDWAEYSEEMQIHTQAYEVTEVRLRGNISSDTLKYNEMFLYIYNIDVELRVNGEIVLTTMDASSANYRHLIGRNCVVIDNPLISEQDTVEIVKIGRAHV